MNQSVSKPFPQSFWVVDKLLCAGCYPWDLLPSLRDEKLHGLVACGLQRYINLIDSRDRNASGNSFELYAPTLKKLARERQMEVECISLPIPDATVPSKETMKRILDYLDASITAGIPTYIHCWGGHGRTSTVVACYLIRHGSSADEAIDMIRNWRLPLPKNHYPFEGEQESFVRSWTESVDERVVTTL
jgi:hypothetical protein